MKRILVAAIHPDDETLGAGGTLLKLKKEGHEIFWLILTKMSERAGFSSLQIEARSQEIKKVASAYGFAGQYDLGLPPGGMDTVALGTLAQEVGRVLADCKPDTLLIPHKFDAHTDHNIGHKILSSALKTFRYPSVTDVLAMETLSETNFSTYHAGESFFPNTYFDVTPYLERKLEIMNFYASEVSTHPFPRSMEALRALAVIRGSEAGVPYAEAFYSIKRIIL